MNILVIGGTSYDSIIYLTNLPNNKPDTIFASNFNETVGSTGAGKALSLQKLGFNTTLHSVIGKDLFGEKIINYFNKTNIKFIYDLDNSTERHTNILDNSGNRISIFTVNSSFNPNININIIEEEIKKCDLVVLNIVNYTRYLIPIIKKHNKLIWTDLHDYDGFNPYHKDYIDSSDYVFFSSEKFHNYKEFMIRLIDEKKKIVVCTHGKNGATAIDENKIFYEEPIISDYKVTDTNGAADSFFSGFLYGYIKSKSIKENLRLGTICSGLSVTSKELVYEALSEKLILSEYKKYYKKNENNEPYFRCY